MTPKQIFDAERALRELKKVQDAMASFDKYVFSASADTVAGTMTPAFPWGNSDLARHLRDDCSNRLYERREDLAREVRELGVVLVCREDGGYVL